MQLCNPKVKFLGYSGKKPVFADGDTINVNKKYTSNNIRVDLRPVKTTKKKEVGMSAEEQQQNQALYKERSSKIQAKIVQIMKARKKMKYMDLPMEVASQINQFKA